MLILLSPSKSITEKKPPYKIPSTVPLFPEITNRLLTKLQSLEKNSLAKQLLISASLANVNYDRFQNWDVLTVKPAFWLYSGDLYNGLDAFTLTEESLDYAQNAVRIISGLYGLIRPLDAIKPYRLEMKIQLSGPWGRNLYEAWGEPIAKHIEASGEKTILMCASKEYSKAVTKELGEGIKILTPRFLQETEKGLQEKGLFAKYARGALTRWLIDHRVSDVNKIKDYTSDGFAYSATLSTESEIVFIVPKDFSLKGRFVKR